MKLIGWMHRKFRQNNGSDAGSACMFCVSRWQSPDDGRPNLLPSILRRDLLPMEKESPASAAAIHFDGLLNIGTFGLPVMMESAVEEIEEKETEMEIDKEVISISDELEKVFADDTEEEWTSVRLSHAGAGGKESEVLPLQRFLLGSSVEVAETIAGEDRRRERSVSLGELFMKSRATEEGGGGGKKHDPLPEGKGTKKMRMGEETNVGSVGKKRMLNICGYTGNGGGVGGATGICRGKLIKILRMFRRKIHPENSVGSKKSKKPSKSDSSRRKSSTPNRGRRNCAEGYDKKFYPPKMAEEADLSFSTVKNRCPYNESRALLRKSSTNNREHWIKTDADYLVLEL